jgi:hypothetical protein
LRFEISDIKQHKFFRGVDWDKVAKRQIKPPITELKIVPKEKINVTSFLKNEFKTNCSEMSADPDDAS